MAKLQQLVTQQSAAAAVNFFNQVAEVAEEEGHHPDLHLTDYRQVQVGLQNTVVLQGTIEQLHHALLCEASCRLSFTVSNMLIRWCVAGCAKHTLNWRVVNV